MQKLYSDYGRILARKTEFLSPLFCLAQSVRMLRTMISRMRGSGMLASRLLQTSGGNKMPKGFREFEQPKERDSKPEPASSSDGGKGNKKEKESKNDFEFSANFKMTPQNVFFYGIPTLFLLYSLSSQRNESEITWYSIHSYFRHDFINNYLDKGLVDHLVNSFPYSSGSCK